MGGLPKMGGGVVFEMGGSLHPSTNYDMSTIAGWSFTEGTDLFQGAPGW